MLPIPVSRANVAVLLVDLQNGYCDPQGDAATTLGWDCAPMQDVCERHVPFVQELRRILPPQHIIWVRFEEHEATLAPNIPRKGDGDFNRICVRGTPGFDYHIVEPAQDEAEVLKFHPSAFHKDARVHTIGHSGLAIKTGLNATSSDPTNLHDYLQMIGVDTLAFTGVVATRCVYGSIIGASIFGYKSVCLTDLLAVPGGKRFESEAATHEVTRDLFYSYPASSQAFLAALRAVGDLRPNNLPAHIPG